MNQQELNAHFQLISQRLSRHNWNHTFVDTTHIKIDGNAPDKILFLSSTIDGNKIFNIDEITLESRPFSPFLIE